MNLRAIGITMGDPAGVGPEVVVKALHKRPPPVSTIVIGNAERLREAARRAHIEVTVTEVDHPRNIAPGSPVIHCLDPGVPGQDG